MTVRSVLSIGMTWQDEEPGGLNRYLGDLHAALRAAGVRSTVAVSGDLPDDPDSGLHRVSGSRLRRLVGLRALVRRKAADADVLHSHFALHAALPVLTGGRRGRPLVTSFQGPWAAECRTEGDASDLRFAVRRSVERAVYRRSRVSVCLSEAFAQVLVRDYGVAPWRTRVVRPGVDLEAFRPMARTAARAALGLPTDGLVVVSVRRLAERMGLDVLLEAWARRPDGLLLLAGEGPLRAALLERAAGLGLGPERVRFLGRVPEEDLPRLYAAADLSVVPTLELEGFGLVVLESLACGTPVVATRVGGLAEVLPDLQDDALVEPGDVAALASRIASAADGSRPLPDAARCRAFAEGYGWAQVAKTFLDLYGEAVRDDVEPRTRVAYLLSTAQPSGGELALLRTLAALEDSVSAHVVVAEEGPVCDLLDAAGVSWELLPLGSAARARRDAAGRSPLGSALLALRFAAYSVRLGQRLRVLQPDVVHANSLKAGVYGGVAARLAGRPLVWHVRDRLADDYLPGPVVRAVRVAVERLPDAVVANSRATMETLRTTSRQDAVVVPSPVDRPAGFARTASSGPLRVVSVGRLAPWKGQHVLLDAFAQAFPRSGAALTVVGGALFGEDDYAEELRTQAERLGIDDRVRFLGHRPDVWALLAEADVLVHCSVIPEPHGNVVAEGLAAGLAVVAADAGGPRDLVRPGVTGVLTPPGDVAALADALVLLAGDAELRARLGEAAARSVDHLRAEVGAAQLAALYGRLAPRPVAVEVG